MPERDRYRTRSLRLRDNSLGREEVRLFYATTTVEGEEKARTGTCEKGEQEDGGLRNKKSCVYSMGQPREGDFLPE